MANMHDDYWWQHTIMISNSGITNNSLPPSAALALWEKAWPQPACSPIALHTALQQDWPILELMISFDDPVEPYLDINALDEKGRRLIKAEGRHLHTHLGTAWFKEMSVAENLRQQRHGTRMMFHSLRLCQLFGVHRISSQSGRENGGYAWARIGFLADEKRGPLAQADMPKIVAAKLANLPTADGTQAMQLASEIATRPTALWDLADSALGPALLNGTNYPIAFDFTNPAQVERANRYFGRTIGRALC